MIEIAIFTTLCGLALAAVGWAYAGPRVRHAMRRRRRRQAREWG